ncbi:MAG: transposase [Bacteroidota bacterium]|mgnify:FL=1
MGKDRKPLLFVFRIPSPEEIKKGTSLDAVGALFGKTSPRIWTIFNGWINAAYAKSVIDTKLSAIGIDEITDQAKRQQITVTIDLKNERVIRITKEVGKKALQDMRNYLVSKGIPPEQIKHVSGPLPKINESHRSSPFAEDVKTCFSNAEYHVDRLYIIELLNKAMDQVRKKVTKGTQETKDLTESRYLFVKPPTLLSVEQKEKVHKLSAQFPIVGKAYELKTAFSTLWGQSSLQATETFLESWCQEVSQDRLSLLKPAAELLKTEKKHIVRFLDLPADSSVMEKIHENILATTKRNKGFKSFENASNMILFFCGKLTFPYIES